jgi:hypothetical protein
MRFTKQDAITFALGAGAALGIELGVWLVRLQVESEKTEFSLEQFGVSMGVGLAAALGRYLVTRIPDLLSRSGGGTAGRE